MHKYAVYLALFSTSKQLWLSRLFIGRQYDVIRQDMHNYAVYLASFLNLKAAYVKYYAINWSTVFDTDTHFLVYL